MGRKTGIKYNVKPAEPRGWSKELQEPRMVRSFWTVHTMDQIQAMTPEELDIAIDKFIEDFASRQTKNNKRWDFPLLRVHSRH